MQYIGIERYCRKHRAEFENILDISFDNDGGWIITTGTAVNPLAQVARHWSESSFLALQERGVVFNRRIDPTKAITRGEFAQLCGLDRPLDPAAPLLRQDAAKLLETALCDKTLTYLVFTDLDSISGSAFQSVQMCVASGIFSHAEGIAFRPTDQMTWAEAATTALRYMQSCDAHADESEDNGETENTGETSENETTDTNE